jgi:putative phosphoribosyl transferase
MIFENRADAGRRLAHQLHRYASFPNLIVLGIARGGVPVAFEVAMFLNAPMDVFICRKLGVPGQEELAFGAIASGGVRVLDFHIAEACGISEAEIEEITGLAQTELERRERAYRGNRSALNISGRTVILVDDGIATGASTRAAIAALRQHKPKRLILAVPVAPASTYSRLEPEVHDLVCLYTPEGFFGIGQFYKDFGQVTDNEVIDLLDRAQRSVRTKPSMTVLR